MGNSLLTQALSTSFEELTEDLVVDEDPLNRVISLVDSSDTSEIDDQATTLDQLIMSVESLLVLKMNISEIGYSSENLKPALDVFFSYNPPELKPLVSLESEGGIGSAISKFLSSIWAIIRTICKAIGNWWKTMGDSKEARENTIKILKEQIPRIKGTPADNEIAIGSFSYFIMDGKPLTVDTFKEIGKWYGSIEALKMPPAAEIEAGIAKIIAGPSKAEDALDKMSMGYRKLIHQALTNKYAVAVFGDRFKPVVKSDEDYLKEAQEKAEKAAQVRKDAPTNMTIFTKAELEVVLSVMVTINNFLNTMAKSDESADVAWAVDKAIKNRKLDEPPLPDEIKTKLKEYADYLKRRMDLYLEHGKHAAKAFKLMYSFVRYNINHYPHITLVKTDINS